MNKKKQNQKDLEESVHQKLSDDQCQQVGCGTKFYGSTCAKISHYQLYPQHLIEQPKVSGKVDAAIHEDLQGKIYKAKKEATQ